MTPEDLAYRRALTNSQIEADVPLTDEEVAVLVTRTQTPQSTADHKALTGFLERNQKLVEAGLDAAIERKSGADQWKLLSDEQIAKETHAAMQGFLANLQAANQKIPAAFKLLAAMVEETCTRLRSRKAP